MTELTNRATPAQWVAGARPRTLPAAIAPVLAGSGLAFFVGSFRPLAALLALVVSLALQVGVNYANDYSDGIRGTDAERIGPLRLVVGGTPVAIRGAKRRAALGLLALAEGRTVTVEALVDALWPDEVPDSGRAALHSVVSRLRDDLGAAAARLETDPQGYRLALGDDELDLSRVRTLLRQPQEEPVIQDVEIPVDRLPEFLDGFHRDIGITPVWLCPVQLRPGPGGEARPWPLYPMEPGELYVNVGFWSGVPQRTGDPEWHNRRVEALTADLGGHKSLYSTVHYEEPEFWERYNGPAYRKLKERYDPDGRLPDLYSKVTGRQ